jgi:2-polyprenyl-6-methoxyphenol hydroxylase-like FAD-dependent oxidoreductase
MQVWDEGGNGYVRYSAENVGMDTMGYVVENKVLQAAFGHRLKLADSVNLLCPVRHKHILIWTSFCPNIALYRACNESCRPVQ